MREEIEKLSSLRKRIITSRAKFNFSLSLSLVFEQRSASVMNGRPFLSFFFDIDSLKRVFVVEINLLHPI